MSSSAAGIEFGEATGFATFFEMAVEDLVTALGDLGTNDLADEDINPCGDCPCGGFCRNDVNLGADAGDCSCGGTCKTASDPIEWNVYTGPDAAEPTGFICNPPVGVPGPFKNSPTLYRVVTQRLRIIAEFGTDDEYALDAIDILREMGEV